MIGHSGNDAALACIRRAEPCFWANPPAFATVLDDPLGFAVEQAEDRLHRATGLLGKLFPALDGQQYPLRSPLRSASKLATTLGEAPALASRHWIKADHELPVAGSVKARGGFHEVIVVAEKIAVEHGLIDPSADLEALAAPAARALFADHTIVVGSTGNLGMGIGLIASALGFRAVIHMSHDAKEWKKQRLRTHGATVIEHAGDYAQAVANGRRSAELDPFAHFVDDEGSVDLFTGYAASARELSGQLRERDIVVDADNPLFVYIPCGVGGAPGGITYGLKRIFGPNVHCIFAEPVQSPAMLVQLIHGMERPTSVYEMGLTNRTEADGLAVGQASQLVAPLMQQRLDAIYTLSDDQLFSLLRADLASDNFGVEPSAAAAYAGPVFLRTPAGQAYLDAAGLRATFARATHVMWTTGGSLVPPDERANVNRRAASAPVFRANGAETGSVTEHEGVGLGATRPV